MSENKIPYSDRTFEDYKASLKDYVARYYPQIATDFDDASIGSWLIDLVALIGDNLSFNIDKAFNETNIDTAAQAGSIYNIARTNGFKVPGPKGAMAEVEFSCIVPTAGDAQMPDRRYYPVIKRGTRVASSNQAFEVMSDIDFGSQVNEYGVSDRNISPLRNGGGYLVTKTAVVEAGESKIYKQVVRSEDIKPFMEVIIPDGDVMCVDGIVFKQDTNHLKDPNIEEFLGNSEMFIKDNCETYRYFEVDSLIDQYRWADDDVSEYDSTDCAPVKPESFTYSYYDDKTMSYVPVSTIAKGRWIPITQKFITEFTDKGYLKIIFGSGNSTGMPETRFTNNFSEYQISRMVNNNFLGKLPPAGCTMYVLYRSGGGAASNVPAGAINNIVYLNFDIGDMNLVCDSENASKIAGVRQSLRVTNPRPSVSGKDTPTADEIRMMIKYNSGSQNRCVTVKDYENRIMMLPSRYGSPFRVSAIEENNKIKIFLLGLDHNGKLSATLPEVLLRNIEEYLVQYRSVNDFVSISAGEVIHLGFHVDIMVDKNYVYADVAKNVMNVINDYMNINKHNMGEDIFVGDIEKEISKVDGVVNLINLSVYNLYFNNGSPYTNYSTSRIAQSVENDSAGKDLILLDDTQYVLNSNVDSMFEINNPEKDITVSMIAR